MSMATANEWRKQRWEGNPSVPGDPLPDDLPEGDSLDTEVADNNDTPPGVDPRNVSQTSRIQINGESKVLFYDNAGQLLGERTVDGD